MSDACFRGLMERLLSAAQSTTDSDLASVLRITAQSVSQARKKRHIPAQWYVKLFHEYGISVDWLLSGKGSMRAEAQAAPPRLCDSVTPPARLLSTSAAREDGHAPVAGAVSGPESRETRLTAPPQVSVRGLAACGVEGWYNPSAMAFTLPLPPGLDFHADIFAVIAVGVSMQPEGIRHGYVLFCDPRKPLEPGDAVFVEKADGKVTVKKFLKFDEKWLHLQGWLPPTGGDEAQKPYTEKIDREYVRGTACVVLVKRKA